ncbi:hypothetical protein BDB00DRAFT_820321 [Zychaea mexicana]|uniref:uncharacterized protein n=1 Tax=Zychaea mexicana TaxID=64656 RepID=UPI0022FE436A|nr:uncharacterized protein BDB00DRAFT_820321 [Zychaea mexicana]KAI9493986.1 hypothetical protein BDB00DRAFT_820321 [Zychaea mexicana]
MYPAKVIYENLIVPRNLDSNGKHTNNIYVSGCRERKKKCSSGQPCERCNRLGIECHYLKPAAPPDINYVDLVNSQELEAHVDELENLLFDMEQEMQRLQQTPPLRDRMPVVCRPTMTMRQYSDELPSMGSNCSSGSSSGSSVSSPGSVSSTTPSLKPAKLSIVKRRKQQHLFDQQQQQQQQQQQHLPTATSDWQLKIGKHGLCIETNILSYDDLLHQIQAFGISKMADEEFFLPMLKQPSSSTLNNSMLPRYVLNTPMRRAHFRAIKHCIALNEQEQKQPKAAGLPIRNKDGDDNSGHGGVLHFKQRKFTQQTILHLLDAFFRCQFYQNICLHRSTFYSLFVDRDDPESSPVVCAMAGAILTMRCHHVLEIIPYSQQIHIHTHCIARAKYLLSNIFDELSLEPYLTYLFMALYYINLQRPNDAVRYFEQSVRIRHLLAAEYMPKKDATGHTNEQELFKRSHKVLFQIAQRIDFFNNRRGIIVRSMEKTRQQSRSMVSELTRYVKRMDCSPVPLPDESAKIARAIKKDTYGVRLHSVLLPYLNLTRFSSDPIPLPMLIKTEAALNEYYFKDLPPEFRLSLSIFENNLSDAEFQRRLSNDDNCDSTSIALAIRYYQAVISIHEPFIPILPREYSLNNNKTIKDATLGPISVLSTDEDSPSCGTYEEEERAIHSMRALEMCYRSAIILVRLFEYLIVTLDTCTDMLMPCLLSAWDVHVRNACLGLIDPEEAQKHVPIRVVKASREYVLRCVDIVRKGYHYNAADRAMWEHHQSIESELLKAMFATRPYTAQYWDPWAPTNAW